MLSIEVDYVGEGTSDDVIARRMIAAVNCRPGTSYRRPLSGTGKHSLDGRLAGLNKGAVYRNPVLAIRDLDQDAPCAPALVAQLLADRNPSMLLRISVRTTESWLMADRQAYADYCGASLSDIPNEPENAANLKELVHGLAQSGRAPHLQRHLKKAAASGVPLWGAFGGWHAQFAEEYWSPLRAAESGRAPSLSRAIHRMRQLIEQLSEAAS